MKLRSISKRVAAKPTRMTKRSSERGIYLMIFIGSLIAILFVVGLAIDSAHLYHKKLQIQRAVDAATIRATMSLRSSATPEEIQQIANDIVADNLAQYNLLDRDRIGSDTNWPINVVVDPVGASPRTVTVRANSDVPFLLFNSASSPSWGTKRLDAYARGAAEKLCIGLVLDATTSLNETPPGQSMSKLAALRLAAIGFVNQFVEGYDLFSLTTFNAVATVRFPMDLLDKSALNSYISGMETHHFTNIADGIKVGTETLTTGPGNNAACDGGRKILVLFTDGAPTHPRTDGREVDGGPVIFPTYHPEAHPALGSCVVPYVGDPDYSVVPSGDDSDGGTSARNLHRRKTAQILSILQADAARASQGVEIYTIGLGAENPVARHRAYGDLTTVVPSGSEGGSLMDWDHELKGDLLRRIANDSSLEVRPAGMDFDCVPNREVYNAGDDPPHTGLYLGTPNAAELSSLFNQLALLLNGRIVDLR